MSNNSTNLSIGGYSFKCVSLSDADFNDIAAIYVIICVDSYGKWVVLDVGQSGEVGSRIDSHERKKCWQQYCSNGSIWVCVHKMPSSQYSKSDRLEREKELRNKLDPKCGEV